MEDGPLKELASHLKDIESTRYSELASSAIIIYDYLLTLDQEVQFIWRARWTVGKVLFFLNRYYTLFVVIFNNYALFSPSLTDDVRLHWFKWQGWTGLTAAALAETILQLRLYALFHGNKKVLALMIGFFIAAMAASATIMGTALEGIQAYSHLVPGTTFCVPLAIPSHFYAFWIPILSFETLLCSLACIRGYKSYKDREIRRLSLRRSIPQRGTTGAELNILEVLLRDSVGYFIIAFATYFTTTMMWILAPETMLEIPIGFTVALSGVIANRLLLNLRGSQRGSAPGAGAGAGANAAGANNNNNNAVNPTMSSNSHSFGVVLTTVEDGHGRELSGGYELLALRSLKVST